MDIAKYILKKMAVGDIVRYRDLKPSGAESNLFVYHLKRLIKEGLLEKVVGGYKLTGNGLRFVDKISFSSVEHRVQPKIVNLLIIKNNNGEHLLYFNKRQPFHGLAGFPYGKIHFGENFLVAAKRELKEKTGLLADVSHKGDAYLLVYKDQELVSHMLCHVFFSDKFSGSLICDSEKGVCQWANAAKFKSKFIPGFFEILELAEKSKKHFFEELIFNK